MTVEIVLLAIVALFVGRRLYSVLGRRTGHRAAPNPPPAETPCRPDRPRRSPTSPRAPRASGLVYVGLASAEPRDHLRRPELRLARFLEGARAAYRMILEAS